MSPFSFQDTPLYQKSLNFISWSKHLIRDLPSAYAEEKNQLNRAATSITYTFAEGYGRYHPKEKRNFYVISRGSMFECVAILDSLLKVDALTPDRYTQGIDQLVELAKMISGLIGRMGA